MITCSLKHAADGLQFRIDRDKPGRWGVHYYVRFVDDVLTDEGAIIRYLAMIVPEIERRSAVKILDLVRRRQTFHFEIVDGMITDAW